MGLSVRLAPGVSLRASTRGVGASVGPRVARVHAGPGGVGLSSGMGPVTASTRLSGGRKSNGRPRSSGASQRSNEVSGALAAGSAAVAVLSLWASYEESKLKERYKEARELEATLLNQHRVAYRAATRREARLSAREKLRRPSKRQAAEQDARGRQDLFDKEWRNLIQHDPHTVIKLIDEAFEDNQMPSTCIDAGSDDGGNYVTVVILMPGHEVIGPVRDSKTKKVRARTPREGIEFYNRVLASTVVGTVNEAFAVSPQTMTVRAVVLRREKRLLRSEKVVPIYSRSLARDDAGTDWSDTELTDEMLGATSGADVNADLQGMLRPLEAREYRELFAVAKLFGDVLAAPTE